MAPAPVAKGSAQCRWVNTLKSGAPTMVQVAIAPAQVWAKSVPMQVDSALRSGRAADDKLRAKLLAAKKKISRGADKLSDKEACTMFSLLVQSNGRKKGVTETISFPPFGTQIAAQGRTCRFGIYATVTYSELGHQAVVGAERGRAPARQDRGPACQQDELRRLAGEVAGSGHGKMADPTDVVGSANGCTGGNRKPQ